MIRKRSSLIAALMVLAMILSYLPTVTVFAANEVREGLVIGWPDWDEKGEPHFAPDKEEMSDGLGMDSAHTNHLTIGWADAKGSITPLSYGDLDYLSISYADGKATDYYLNLAMDTRYIEEEDQWILDTKEQGIFDIGIPLPGEYILTYSGPESRGMDEDACTVRISTSMPLIGMYSQDTPSADALLWSRDIKYGENREFYILPYPFTISDENGNLSRRDLAADFHLTVDNSDKVEISESASGYKIVINDEDADWIEIRAEYICHHYWYDAKNDEWIEDGRDEQEKTFT